MHVSHIERIAIISGSTAFELDTFPINPGLSTSFPWLAPIARRYETYQFNSLSFLYKTKTSTAIVGDVTMGPDYNPIDSPPSSTQEMEAFQDAKNSQPWADFTVTCGKARLSKMKSYFVRNGAVPAGASILNYDPCTLYVATEGQAAPGIVGYLYAKYDITFTTPEFNNQVDGVVGGTFKSTTATGATQTNALNGALSAGTLAGGTSAAGVLTLASPGTYLLAFSTVASAGTISSFPAPPVTGGTRTRLSDNGLGGSQGSITESFVTTAPNATWGPVTVTGATGITTAEVNFAIALPGSLVT